MSSQAGWTQFLEVEGIIVTIYVACITLLVVHKRIMQNRMRCIARARNRRIAERRDITCKHCLGEVTQLYRLGRFGPCCFVCCANFAQACGADSDDIIPVSRTENM